MKYENISSAQQLKERKFQNEFDRALYDSRHNEVPGEVLDKGAAIALNVTGGLTPYAGEWNDAARLHLLRRTMFGVRKEDLNLLRNMSFAEAIDQIVQLSPKPAAPVNDYNGDGFVDPDVPFGETWIAAPFTEDSASPRVVSLKRWLIQNMIHQEMTIHEKMLFFWHNHLVVQTWDVFMPGGSYRYFDMLRTNALGNFKELVKAVTIDASMLLYLNGFLNNKEAFDENYARELQELFCIGKGPNANFTESDVQMAAKVLTGWTIQWPERTTRWANWAHDETDKQFSAFYNNRVIQGRSGAAGQEETDELIDMIFENNETALFICRKLYRFFVYSEISDQAEMDVIEPLAQMLRDNNYEILPVVKTLLASEHFFDAEIRAAQLKSPTDFLLGFWRMTGAEIPANYNLYEKGLVTNAMLWRMSGMGLQVGDPPNVAGYPAYYQTPIYDRSWITTDTITERALITDSFIYWGYWTPLDNIFIQLTDFVGQFDDPGNPNELLNEAFTLCCPLTPNDRVRASLKAILLSNQQTDSYWTNAWNNHVNNPNNEEFKMIVESRLEDMFRRLFQLAEFQLI